MPDAEEGYQVQVSFKGHGGIPVRARSKAEAMRKVKAGEHEEWDWWDIEEVYVLKAVDDAGR